MTICAISTPAGIGGIAVIRVSGKESIAICDRIFVPHKGSSPLKDTEGYVARYGKIMNADGILDEVVATVFRAPHSFTGEDTVEISCHGSLYIQQELLRLLIKEGCRMAMPGEFTQRAFLNGKMDLSQAEAVADVIASQSAASHRVAMNQMRGGYSNELHILRDKLLHLSSLLELELDFSEEEVEFADRRQLLEVAQEIETLLQKLTNSFAAGNAIKKGIPVAIVGETNVGKSTLLNLLVNEERALVSDIHGTTRDFIEDTVSLQGILFRFIDTAGIRNTTDTVENMGIERTYEKIAQAQIILWLVDCTQVSEHIEWLADRIVRRSEGKKLIIVFNKLDKIAAEEKEVLQQLFENYPAEKLFISAKKQLNTDMLERALLEAARLPQLSENDVIVTNMRHYEALTKALESIQEAQAGLTDGIASDLVAEDIRACIHYLGNITGEITNDEILGNIFSKFCIGK